MDTTLETLDDPQTGGPERRQPGLIVAHLAGRPACRVLTIPRGGLELGRESLGGADERMSRRHAIVRVDGAEVEIEDLGSRNGTWLDGARVEGTIRRSRARVLRTGRSVHLLVSDVAPFAAGGVRVEGGVVLGPALSEHLARARLARESGRHLLVLGETGAGKELVARAFHEAGSGGAFVAVNCAAIPATLAERLLFGAVRGAYSSADGDADGYVQAAEGGTLFLDEIGELDPGTQAKLLRFVETGEVFAVGSARPRRASVALCFATHRDLAADAQAGRFRPDLWHRIARPCVELAPLRARAEEIPWLVAQAVERVAPELGVPAAFVERALLAPWAGNVRELLAVVAEAAERARARGAVELDETALPAVEPGSAGEPELDAATVDQALLDARGNVSAAARALGVHRNRVRRHLERRGRTVTDDG